MRKYLLPEQGKFYRANLHCHTTVSDGKTTPEETKQFYKDEGYSIIAFTDHTNSVLIYIAQIQTYQLTATDATVEKQHQDRIITFLIWSGNRL